MPREYLTYPEEVWAGSEHSLELARDVHAKVVSKALVPVEKSDEDDVPYNFSLQGAVGVIGIKGPLVNSDSPWVRFFGATSYNDIRKALMYAAGNAEAKAIVLDISSGGGAVSGVSDTSSLISLIDSKVKPVYSITDAAMASAAYWLGSSARKVYNSNLALMGSIGVIATHMEYSKALKEDGVGVTVVRAGKYKALVNSVEPLTDQAKQQIQDQLDATYRVFVEHVAAARGVSYQVADQKMGQGREFIGADAVDAGLSDGVKTFDSLLSEINAKLDTKSSSLDNSNHPQRGVFPMRKALTEQEIAAIAAGVAHAAAVEGSTAPEIKPEVDAEASVKAPAAEATETKKENESPAPAADVLTFVKEQLAEAQARVVDLTVQLKTAGEQIISMKATHDGLVKIAAASVKNMKVALGMTGVDVSSMAADALLAEHAAASDAFQKAFKAGGVAAVNTPDKAEEAAKPAPHHKALIAATRLTN